MNEETIDACIKELRLIRDGLNIMANKKIMGTGRGALILDGQVLGLNMAITALEDLKGGEDDG